MPKRKTAPPRGVLKTVPPTGGISEHFRYHPSPDLAAYVEHFWCVRWDRRGLPPHPVETLPHPSVHLVFPQGKGGEIRGVAHGKFSTTLRGRSGVFAAKFRPGGFRVFVDTPVDAFTDRVVAVGELWGADGDRLAKAVRTAGDDDARIAAIETFLRSRHPQPDARATLATTIVEAIAADRGLGTVRDVTRTFNLSIRALQRLFAQYVGVSPKWVIQRYRLHEAAEQLSRPPASQAALAAELGFADQAHFVKNFKAAVGTSPAAYARRGTAGVGSGRKSRAPHSAKGND